MSAEILAIPGVTRPDQPVGLQPVSGVIEALEQLLKEARAGDIRAFAAVVVRANGYVGTQWERPSDANHGHELTAGVHYLAHRYTAMMVEASEPVSQEPPVA